MICQSHVTIFDKCGICGVSVTKGDHIGIRLDDDDFDETWQWYHPKCYGSKFNNIPRNQTTKPCEKCISFITLGDGEQICEVCKYAKDWKERGLR